LSHHKLLYHSKLVRIKCELCDKICVNRHQYLTHKNRAHNTKKISCAHCDTVVLSITLLRKHLCKKHPDIYLKDKPHWCSICYFNFCTEKEFNSHMEEHSNLKCYFCGKYCPSPSYLAVHLRIYTRERPFKCSSCECWFKTNGNLTVSQSYTVSNEASIIRSIFFLESCECTP